jgi:hydrogenase-4 component E
MAEDFGIAGRGKLYEETGTIRDVIQNHLLQVVGFLAMENGLFFAATSATYGMPMVVELGIALDVLVAVLILGIFFFHIREQFDSLDLHHLESLKED